MVNSSFFHLVSCPEHRLIFYIAPEVNHIIVVLAIGLTALGSGLDGDAVAEVIQVNNHAHGWQPFYRELPRLGVPAGIVDRVRAAVGGEWATIDQILNQADATLSQWVADESRRMQVTPLPFVAVFTERSYGV